MPGVITGKHVLYDVSLLVNSVDLSDHVESVSFIATTVKHPGSAMSDLNQYSIPGELALSDPTVTFYQDYNTAKVYITLKTAWEARTIFNLVAKASSGANAPTNPCWTIPVFVSSMPIMTGKKGDRHMAPVTFAVAGTYSIATA